MLSASPLTGKDFLITAHFEALSKADAQSIRQWLWATILKHCKHPRQQ
jgi:hypothetical protein